MFGCRSTLLCMWSLLPCTKYGDIIAFRLFFTVKLTPAILRYGTAVNRQKLNVRFEVFMAGTMKNGVFWDVTPCGSCKNRRSGVTESVN
jgi:hypothetical protein